MSQLFISKQKATFTLGALICAATVFAGCTGGSQTDSVNSESNSGYTETQGGAAPAADQKQGDTTKSGTITKVGEDYYLTETGQTPKMVESYAVELGDFVGQIVTVTGQYSGDTLFIGKVE